MEQFLLNSGIEIESLVLLLLLPVAATLIGIARHLIGFKSLGIYLSLVLVFIFYELGLIEGTVYSDPLVGLKHGILLVVVIFLSAAFSYKLVRKMSIHYYPKLSIILVNVTLTLLLMIIIFQLLGISYLIKINTFTLILIAGIAEKYISILTRKRLKETLIITAESLAQAIICYLIISLHPFIDFIIKYPYAILLLFPINYLVGKFAGLRLSEYIRFKKILDKLE
jgi:hypothetical protein